MSLEHLTWGEGSQTQNPTGRVIPDTSCVGKAREGGNRRVVIAGWERRNLRGMLTGTGLLTGANVFRSYAAVTVAQLCEYTKNDFAVHGLTVKF